MRDIEQKLDNLMKERNHDEICYLQGYIAALRFAVEQVRKDTKQRIVQNNEEED